MREDLPDHFIESAHAALPILGADASWDAASCYLMGLADGYRAGRAVQP